MSARESLIARDRATLWHPYTQMQTAPAPLPIVRGEGVYLYTEDGRKILDGISSWWVNIHGHSNPRINAALAEQAGRLEHVMFAGCTHAPAVELAERLITVLPPGLTRVFYSDNGSTAGMRYSPNCGDVNGSHSSQFQAAADHGTGSGHNWSAGLSDAAAKCYLGGDPTLTNGWTASNSKGKWIQFTTSPDSRLVSLNRPDRNYLFPLHRSLNVNFKGVIYVNGKVGVSGVARGRVSIVSPNSIIILDDLRQANDPGTGICDDIIGLITTGNVVLSDNVFNTPQKKTTGTTLKTYDDTGSEFLQAVILALGIFTDENYG